MTVEENKAIARHWEDIVAEEDKVALHWSGRGTHKGEYWGPVSR